MGISGHQWSDSMFLFIQHQTIFTYHCVTHFLHLILKHTSRRLLLVVVCCSSPPLPQGKGWLFHGQPKAQLQAVLLVYIPTFKGSPPPLQGHYTDNYTLGLLKAIVESVLSSCKGKAIMYDFIFQTCSVILAGKYVSWPKLLWVILSVLRGLRSHVKASMTHANGCYMDVMTEWTCWATGKGLSSLIHRYTVSSTMRFNIPVQNSGIN